MSEDVSQNNIEEDLCSHMVGKFALTSGKVLCNVTKDTDIFAQVTDLTKVLTFLAGVWSKKAWLLTRAYNQRANYVVFEKEGVV